MTDRHKEAREEAVARTLYEKGLVTLEIAPAVARAAIEALSTLPTGEDALREALEAITDAWDGLDGPFIPQMPRLYKQAKAALLTTKPADFGGPIEAGPGWNDPPDPPHDPQLREPSSDAPKCASCDAPLQSDCPTCRRDWQS